MPGDDVFTLKLKCHEYEKRLKKVGLHGLSGAVLQEENEALTASLAQKKDALEMAEREASTLKSLCLKSRETIERLQNDAHSRRRRVVELEKEVEAIVPERDNLRKICQDLRSSVAALSAESEKRMEAEQVNARLSESLEKYKVALKEYVGMKQRLVSQVSELKEYQAKVAVEHECMRKDAISKDEKIESLQTELADKGKEVQKRVRDAISDANVLVATENEKMKSLLSEKALAFETHFEELREKIRIKEDQVAALSASCERLRVRSQLSAQREKAAKSELAKANAKLDTASRQKQLELSQVVENEKDKHFREVGELEEKLTLKIEALRMRLSEERTKRKEEVRKLELENEDLKLKLDRTKKIWKRSIGKRVGGKENGSSEQGLRTRKPNSSSARRSSSKPKTRKVIKSKVMESLAGRGAR